MTMAKTKNEKQGTYVKECPDCKKWNHHKSKVCASCGAALAISPPASKPSENGKHHVEGLPEMIGYAEKLVKMAGGAARAKELIGIVEKFQATPLN